MTLKQCQPGTDSSFNLHYLALESASPMFFLKTIENPETPLATNNLPKCESVSVTLRSPLHLQIIPYIFAISVIAVHLLLSLPVLPVYPYFLLCVFVLTTRAPSVC